MELSISDEKTLYQRGANRCTGEVQVVAREWNRQPGEGQPRIAR
jgi:hypothetical protein